MFYVTVCELLSTDNLTYGKFIESIKSDAYLYDMNGKYAVSVTIKSLAAGLSGKLAGGDAVSILAFKRGASIEEESVLLAPPELECVRLASVINSSGAEINESDPLARDNKTPAAITLLVNGKQAKKLVELENTANIHVVFIARGAAADSKINDFDKRFDTATDKTLESK